MTSIASEFAGWMQRHTAPQVDCCYEPLTWVGLHERPNDSSYDQALLLCECDYSYWMAWVPDFGEIFLHENEFYPLDAP